MVQIKCPRCKSSIEISEFKENDEDRIAIFCKQEECLYYKNPLIGIDRKNSEVFISVGNDLGFKCSTDKKQREKSFYAVGDYRTNILNKRDEAQSNLSWMGYDLYESRVAPGRLMYDLFPMGISGQLWISKTWLEVQATMWAGQKPFRILNASEAGTLGVLYRSFEPKAMEDRDNCYLIDEILPDNWETTTLERACRKFVEVKKCQEATLMGTVYDASNVIGLAGKTGGARTIGL